MRLIIRDSHLTCKVANKCVDIREHMEVVERNEDVPLFYPALIKIVSVCERKPK